jgi:hypothetical protein
MLMEARVKMLSFKLNDEAIHFDELTPLELTLQKKESKVC